MKYNDNGEYKDIYIKTFDTLPVGTEVDFDGETVPDGWSEIQDYSTSEIDTGKKWIDGKKIYRKVVNDTLGTTNGTWKDISAFTANEIDTIVKLDAVFRYNNGAYLSVPFTRATDSSYSNREYVLYNCNTGTGNVAVIGYHPSNYNLMSGAKFIAIIEYTKSN